MPGRSLVNFESPHLFGLWALQADLTRQAQNQNAGGEARSPIPQSKIPAEVISNFCLCWMCFPQHLYNNSGSFSVSWRSCIHQGSVYWYQYRRSSIKRCMDQDCLSSGTGKRSGSPWFLLLLQASLEFCAGTPGRILQSLPLILRLFSSTLLWWSEFQSDKMPLEKQSRCQHL